MASITVPTQTGKPKREFVHLCSLVEAYIEVTGNSRTEQEVVREMLKFLLEQYVVQQCPRPVLVLFGEEPSEEDKVSSTSVYFPESDVYLSTRFVLF